jgi:hypothetical protein
MRFRIGLNYWRIGGTEEEHWSAKRMEGYLILECGLNG